MRLICSLLLLAWCLSAEQSDWIWSARYVVTMGAGQRVIENGAVAVRGDRILAVGPRGEIDRGYKARRRLDQPESLIMPGLVNTHTHVPMSLLRGLADDLRLQDWLNKYIFPAEAKNVNAEFARWGTRLGCLEMALSGTTTFADMYYFEDAVAEATKEAGLRAVLGETILKFPAPDFKTPAEALAFTDRFLQRFRGDPLIVPAVAPHALYTNEEKTIREARALANRYGVPLLIHVSETAEELDTAGQEQGATPVVLLDRLGAFAGRTVAAHAVWLDDGDAELLRLRGVGIAHCPSSNMKLASGVAPVKKMLSLGLAVGLGTDGPAGSNNDFDMFEEMDLAAKLQKVSTLDPEAVPALQALEMATILGARVLGLEKEIGSLEAGKRADMITVRLDAPRAVPLYNVYSQLVYALKGSDVDSVMVNGRLIVRSRRMLTLNQAQVMAAAGRYRATVQASLGR
ncbi:MAG: amidohydrolase family protein [Bryobacteraceae bacterium]